MSQRYDQTALPPSHYSPVGYFDGRRVEPGGWRAWGRRQASLACEYPELADVFTPITQKLNDETLRDLNAAVDVDGKSEEAVAQQFLRKNGLL